MMAQPRRAQEKEEQSPRGSRRMYTLYTQKSFPGQELVVSALMFLAIRSNDHYSWSSQHLCVLNSERIQEILHCVRPNKEMLISTCLRMKQLLLLSFYDVLSANSEEPSWRQLRREMGPTWRDGKYLTWCWWARFRSWHSAPCQVNCGRGSGCAWTLTSLLSMTADFCLFTGLSQTELQASQNGGYQWQQGVVSKRASYKCRVVHEVGWQSPGT